VTFPAHMIVGGSLCGTLLRTESLKTRVWAYISGAILGGLPDTLDWLLAFFGLTLRWSVYDWFHHLVPWFIQLMLFPMGLHIQLDKIVHRFPGYNWWPEFWYLEVGMWLVGGLLTWFTFKEEILRAYLWVKGVISKFKRGMR